jgi:hypothetical protein
MRLNGYVTNDFSGPNKQRSHFFVAFRHCSDE